MRLPLLRFAATDVAVRQPTRHAAAPPPRRTEEFFHKSGVPLLLESAMRGYSCTVFAYGQTGSGKTYTLSGTAEQAESAPATEEGITKRALRQLFRLAEQHRAETGAKVELKASYCEVSGRRGRRRVVGFAPTAHHLRCAGVQRAGV